MTTRLTRRDARRVAVQAQLLTSPRPDDLVDVVRHLTLLQLDPTAAVAPSADVVLWSRLGSSYSPGQLQDALDRQELIELQGMARPAADLALFRAEMARWRPGGPRPPPFPAPRGPGGPAASRCRSGGRTCASGCRTTTPAASTSWTG